MNRQELRDEIDFFIDHLTLEQFGDVALFCADRADRSKEFFELTGIMFSGNPNLPDAKKRVEDFRNWMTDFLESNDVAYSELRELYA